MTRLGLVWLFVAAVVVSGERAAWAGACTSQTCACDDDCSGLVCSSDGHCCGPPITGTPCKKDAGAAGTGGSDAGTPPASSSGGCRIAGTPGTGAVAAALLALAVARRRSKRRG
jgi:hypothetical protein